MDAEYAILCLVRGKLGDAFEKTCLITACFILAVSVVLAVVFPIYHVIYSFSTAFEHKDFETMQRLFSKPERLYEDNGLVKYISDTEINEPRTFIP